MQTKRTPFYDRRLSFIALAAFTLTFYPGSGAHAQSGTPLSGDLRHADSYAFFISTSASGSESAPNGDTSLPESPAPQQSPSPTQPIAGPGHKAPRQATATDPIISPGQIAPNQTVRDKFILSLKNSGSPYALLGDTISAGYSHLTNSSPNYGTDGNAFAQRFGAAVARGSSQNIFSSGIMAPLLREDPRYYQLGRGHSIINRGVYAASRVLITRRDSGRNGPNLSLLSGYLGAAALTQTYYPPKNTSATEIASTYGGSLGGAALGNLVNEFLSDTLQVLHLKKIE